MKLRKLLLAAVGATVLLAALVSSASAERLSSTSQGLRATFRRVEFTGIFTTNCEVTLEGSLHSRTIIKRAGDLIGYITRAILGPCANGAATILTGTLPWHVQYREFTGSLPNITALGTAVIGAGFRIRESFATCLALTTAAKPATGTYNRETGTGTLISARIGGRIPTSCGPEGTLNSTSTALTVLNETSAIRLTLI